MKQAAAWLDQKRSAATVFLKQLRRPRQRALVREILSLQLLFAGIIGALAIAALYWGGQWVLQDNYSRWAMQWTEELNELGAPLYLPDDDEVLLRLESFVDKYPEIDRVSYYRDDGSTMYSIFNGEADRGPVAALPTRKARLLAALTLADEPYVIESSVFNARAFEIFAPVWTESIAGDGLFDIDPLADATDKSINLIGFVGLKLDFQLFHDRLLGNIKIAISILLALLLASGFLARRILRRALSEISDLQAPIAELARGNLDVRFKPAAHSEIAEIVEALRSTTAALGERNARLLELANHDALTGLLNRRRFVDELKKEIDNVTVNELASALLFIDLDQFKYVNDTCGHPAGDRLIRKVADQIKRSVSDNGITARFGGDEFVVLAPETDSAGAKVLGNRILEDMRRLAHIENDNVFHVHCSIGVAMIGADNVDHDELLARADIACREAKISGRNRLEFYDMAGSAAARRVTDVGWMSKLRAAIDNDRLLLRFQPIVEIATGRVTHHEVLLRMRDPDGNFVPPDTFLPAAARFGLMPEIDYWVMENAIAKLAEFRKDRPDLRFAINLSANAFETQDPTEWVLSSLERHSVPASAIIFEITESLAIRHLAYVEREFQSLREIGCELALDDFGTGYSSFSYLQRLPMDYIKIDGCFIRNLLKNPVDRKMVRLIGDVGREVGMKTVAEYVMNSAVLSVLGDLGIDFAQGSYVGKPVAVPSKRSLPITLSSKNSSRPSRAGA